MFTLLDRLLAWLLTPSPNLEARMTVIAQEDDAREQHRCELREAITNMAATAARMPAHWTDRRAALHAKINDLLDQLEAS